MGKDDWDEAIVLRTTPTEDEGELLAYLQSLCERREAAQAQPLLRQELPKPGRTAH